MGIKMIIDDESFDQGKLNYAFVIEKARAIRMRPGIKPSVKVVTDKGHVLYEDGFMYAGGLEALRRDQ